MAHRVLIVEDHPVLREGYKALIGRTVDLSVCGVAASAEEAIRVAPVLIPDVVVADLTLGGMDGIELTKQLIAAGATRAVLIVSAHDELIYAERAVAAGARGYLMKEETIDSFATAIRAVLAGELYLSGQIQDRSLARNPGATSQTGGPAASLTVRELDVYWAFGQGKTTIQIAALLGLSPKTIESHRSNIQRKCGLMDRFDFLRHAFLWVDRTGSQEDAGVKLPEAV